MDLRLSVKELKTTKMLEQESIENAELLYQAGLNSQRASVVENLKTEPSQVNYGGV